MVDEYKDDPGPYFELHLFRFLYGRWIPGCQLWILRPYLVQIPLWSMNTGGGHIAAVPHLQVQIPLWSMNTLFLTTSLCDFGLFRFLYGRWIPFSSTLLIYCQPRSDSSMVDEYITDVKHSVTVDEFRFLYGRWIRYRFTPKEATMVSSDSSMVDEYLFYPPKPVKHSLFRFLYGRWIRWLRDQRPATLSPFRFLYGRWIQNTGRM